jgi:hypothetical protein
VNNELERIEKETVVTKLKPAIPAFVRSPKGTEEITNDLSPDSCCGTDPECKADTGKCSKGILGGT